MHERELPVGALPVGALPVYFEYSSCIILYRTLSLSSSNGYTWYNLLVILIPADSYIATNSSEVTCIQVRTVIAEFA